MATDLLEPSPAPPMPDAELVAEDDQNMESGWHVWCMMLLIDSIEQFFNGRDDFFAGGNQFIYFDLHHARHRNFRGPDFYVVLDVPREPLRQYWCVWEENGRYPNVIVELLSPSTAEMDRTVKKNIYEKTFRTPNYFCFDPSDNRLDGWTLNDDQYRALPLDERGWLCCSQLNLWLGPWRGRFKNRTATWLRFYDAEGRVVPTFEEAAVLRLQQAETELAQVKARLSPAENGPPTVS
jgi:Uma2 family endonuclease